MFKLDDDLLKELGLVGLSAEDKTKMFNHIYETLEMRVGMKLADQMSNDQLSEFEGYIDRNDEPGALKWLETNFPNYKEVVASELDNLKAEIKQVAPQIIASLQNPPAVNPPQALPQQPQQPPTGQQGVPPAPMGPAQPPQAPTA
jgi:hypothetical protein